MRGRAGADDPISAATRAITTRAQPAKIQALHPKLFIAGHSHILKVVYDPVYDLLHVNPGAAGEYGFHKVRTAVRLVIDGADMRDMEVGEWPRK